MRLTGPRRGAVLAIVPALLAAGCSDAGGDPTPASSEAGPTAPGTAAAPSDPTPATPPAGVGIVPALRPWLVLHEGRRLPEPRPGVVVRDVRADPVGPGGATESLGLSLRRGGQARWVLAVVDDDGLHVDMDHPALSSWLTFDQWLQDTADIERGGPGLVLAGMAPDGSMAPRAPGARVLDQAVVPDGALGPLRESRTSRAAVAIVRWQGHRWFVLVERTPRRTRRTTVAASRSGVTADTAAQLLPRWERASRAP